MANNGINWPEVAEGELRKLREHGSMHAPSLEARVSNVDDMVDYLRETARKASAGGEFIVGSGHEGRVPDTIYLWLNEFVFNTDAAFVVAGCSDSLDHSDAFGAPWDNHVGFQLGDIVRSQFTLAGLEPLLGRFEQQGPEPENPGQGPAERAVIALVCTAVSESLSRVGDLGYRVSLSRGDEPRVVTWERHGDHWTSEEFTD